MRNPRKLPLALALSLAIGSGVGAAHANIEPSPSFWRSGGQGWWFYAEPKPEDNAEPEELIPEPEPPQTQQDIVEPPELPPLPPQAEAGEAPPEPLSAEWFRVNLPKYMDRAWNDPTVENVQAYMYLQRFVMDRSQQFADAAELAVLGHPWLDETSTRPTSDAAARRLQRMASAQQRTALDDLAERAGIFFFYHSECQACLDMVDVVGTLQNSFAVIAISVDGQDLPGNPFPDFRADDGHAEQVGVDHFPSLYLASPDGEFAPFAVGPISLSDARQRIMVAARRMGWISESEFNATRPVRNLENNLANALSLDDLVSGEEENFVPPDEVLRRINETIGAQEPW